MAKKKIEIRNVLPKKTTVNGMNIKLKLLNKVLVNDFPVMGAYHSQSKTIEISKDFHTLENIHSTYCHELIHAVCDILSMNQVISHDMEELLAENISKAIDENFVLIPKDRIKKKK